jgi:hypothetical protein
MLFFFFCFFLKILLVSETDNQRKDTEVIQQRGIRKKGQKKGVRERFTCTSAKNFQSLVSAHSTGPCASAVIDICVNSI